MAERDATTQQKDARVTQMRVGWAPQPIPKKLYVFIYDLICVTLPMTTGPTTQTMIAEVSDGREGRDNTRATQMRAGDGLHSPSPHIVRLLRVPFRVLVLLPTGLCNLRYHQK